MRQWTRRNILAGTCVGISALAATSRGAWGEASSQGTGIRFLDMAGEEITLPRPARRIVDLWTIGTAFAIAAHGSPSRIVGVNTIAHAQFKSGLLGRLYPEVLEIPYDLSIGNGAPNIERLAKLDPDLVIDFRQGGHDSAAAMRNAGLRVARYSEIEGGIRATIAALLTMYGQMIGDTTRAQRIIAQMHERLARLDVLKTVSQPDRQSVLLVMPSGDNLFVSGGDAGGLFSDFIYQAGGINAAATLPGFSIASVEQIASWDPDAILVFQSEGADVAQIYDHPILGGGKAVAGRRVYMLPIGANNWGSMGPDEFLSPIWLAELLYPHLLDSVLREDMRQAYATIFDRDMTDQEMDEVLRIDLNSRSANYERFLKRA